MPACYMCMLLTHSCIACTSTHRVKHMHNVPVPSARMHLHACYIARPRVKCLSLQLSHWACTAHAITLCAPTHACRLPRTSCHRCNPPVVLTAYRVTCCMVTCCSCRVSHRPPAAARHACWLPQGAHARPYSCLFKMLFHLSSPIFYFPSLLSTQRVRE